MSEENKFDNANQAQANEVISKSRRTNPDRIVIDPETVAIVNSITAQLAETFNGMVNLKMKEIVNFVLQQRGHLLNKSELRTIRKKYFDDVRAAQWALEKLQEAKGLGQNLTFADVLEKMQFPLQTQQKDNARLVKVSSNSTDLASVEVRRGDDARLTNPDENSSCT